jgi:probable F420-dependent oxidoreductase
VKPRNPYPPAPDGRLPEAYKHVLDPLATLTFAAAHTSKIGLGTSVLDIPYYNPVMLARRLSTLDVLSSGRLRVGLGLGWSEDEMEAAGAEKKDRGARADEFLEILKAIWTTNPVEYRGKYYRLAKSYIGPKPAQKPHPPIILAAFAPPALKRLARLADGWNPVGMPPEAMAQVFGTIQQMAKEAGRDPSALQMIVRANFDIHDKPGGKERPLFVGTLEEIKTDVRRCQEIGAHEMFFDPTFAHGGQSLDKWMEWMEALTTVRS